MTEIERLIAAEVLSRAAGEGELQLNFRTREDGSQFVTAERPGGIWGANTIEGVASAIVSSLCDDLSCLSQEDIAQQFGLIDPRATGSIGGLKGGRAKTAAKGDAARANGKKGGRPRKEGTGN